MVGFIKGAMLAVIVLFTSFIVMLNWQSIIVKVEETLRIEKTDVQRFQTMVERINSPSQVDIKIDLSTRFDIEGTDIIIDRGKNALRRILVDPSAAQFQNTIIAYNWSTQRMSFCGFINAKNPFGGYTGFQPFSINVTLSSSIEKISFRSPLFLDEMPGDFQDRLARLLGQPGDIFERRCGIGFQITLLKSI